MISIKDLSIKKKLIVIQLLITFIILLFYCVFLVVNELRVFRNSVVSQLTSMAQLIGTNSTSALSFLDNETAEEVLSSLRTEENIVNAWIYDAEGNLFAKYSKIGYTDFSFPKVEKESHEFKDGYITLSERIIADDDVFGMVSLRFSMKQYWNVVSQTIIIASFVLIIGMIIAFLLSTLTQKTITNPILHLVETTKKVSETGDYSIHVEKGSKDEIGILYGGFNNMLEQINIREIERDKAEGSLRESEKKYRTLTENIDMGIYRNTPGHEGKFIEVNPAIIKMFGYESRKEFLAINVSDLYQNPEDRTKFNKKMLRDRFVRNEDLKLKRKNGSPFIGSVTAVSVNDEEGNVLYYDGIIEDITERKNAEEELEKHRNHLEELVKERTSELEKKSVELEKTNVRLQEVDRLKSVFLANMSHELRTPMNSIIGFTGILLQGLAGEINEEQRKQLTMVKNSAHHLLRLINDVLDVSKIEAGKVELFPEEFGLADVVREVVDLLTPRASEKGLEILTDMPESNTLFSDKNRLKQVLLNLVVNSVKFTDQGSVKIAAKTLNDKKLEIRVIDTGIGIKKEDIDKLFAPFQQVDMSSTKSHEGTGLGLHLSRKLVNLLGGDISAKSEYGRGSDFILIIPLKLKKDK